MVPDDRLAEAYDFQLPPEQIAQSHAHPRDSSRLLVMRKGTLEDAHFRDLPRYLQAGDLLVLNETRVIAARLFGTRSGGGHAEVLLLRPATQARYDEGALRWLALVKPGRKLHTGASIVFDGFGSAAVLADLESGMREIEFSLRVPFADFLQSAGRMPLPPYIKNDSQEAQDDYQTIFARDPGALPPPRRHCILRKPFWTSLLRGASKLHACRSMSVWVRSGR